MHSPPPLILAHLAVVLALTWKHGEQHSTTLSEVMEEQGPPAGWSNSVTFSQRYPLLTPQLTSTSAPLMQERSGTPPLPSVCSIFISFYHFLPGYTQVPGNYHPISLMRLGKYHCPESL